MKKLLLLLFMVVFGTMSYAQPYWVEKTTTFPATASGVQQISFVDANTLWINALALNSTSTNPIYLRQWAKSIDGGNTWTTGAINVGSTNLGIGSIKGNSATTMYAAAFPTAAGTFGGVWRTTNSGLTWVKQSTASFNTSTSFTNFVTFFNSTDGVCAGDPAGGYFEIYTTTNGGTLWTRVPSANIPAPLDGEYGYTTNFTTVGDIIWFGTNKGRLFKSVNKGLNWTVAQSPLGDFGSANESGNYAFSDANNGILISAVWQQWVTTDGGATWTEVVASGAIRNFNVCAVPGAPNTYVCNGDDLDNEELGMSYTNDGGLNWITLGNHTTIGDIAFFSPTVGFSGGVPASASSGGIWKFTGNQLATENFNTAKALTTASPNPTSGLLQLAGKNISQVVVYDVLGKQISDTNYSALNNVTLNLSSLNSGIYMVKVVNDSGNASTIKVVKQ